MISVVSGAIVIAMEMFTSIFFWYLFAMCSWWFVFYKLQDRVYCLLPSISDDSYIKNYYPYDAMLISLTVIKFLQLLYKIVLVQCDLDIFLIDWESPRMYRFRGKMPKQTVNPWRRLFIVNEFNELQLSQTISSEMLMLLFLVITEGFGYKYFANMEADLTKERTNSPENYLLNFVVIVIVMHIIHFSS